MIERVDDLFLPVWLSFDSHAGGEKENKSTTKRFVIMSCLGL